MKAKSLFNHGALEKLFLLLVNNRLNPVHGSARQTFYFVSPVPFLLNAISSLFAYILDHNFSIGDTSSILLGLLHFSLFSCSILFSFVLILVGIQLINKDISESKRILGIIVAILVAMIPVMLMLYSIIHSMFFFKVISKSPL